ncbi:hypothetical protein TNCV_3357551 [Trichonephila clavipes]|nr:hypothetical protein TNCV_3357551 [Trichonephila clavipes]
MKTSDISRLHRKRWTRLSPEQWAKVTSLSLSFEPGHAKQWDKNHLNNIACLGKRFCLIKHTQFCNFWWKRVGDCVTDDVTAAIDECL